MLFARVPALTRVTGTGSVSCRQVVAPIICVAVLLWSAGGAAPIDARQSQPRDINVVSARPLADVLLELQTRHHWVVTYEDSFYEFRDDVADVTASVRRDGSTEPKVFVPRDRLLQFTYQNAHIARPDVLMAALIEAYHATSDAGDRFRLLRQGAVYHVVPAVGRNANGTRVTRQSRLDVRITLPERSWRTYYTIDAILAEVNRVSGTRLAMGTVPTNLLIQTGGMIAANDEAARDVLVRALALTATAVSWRLFCQPLTPDSYCFLNLDPRRLPE